MKITIATTKFLTADLIVVPLIVSAASGKKTQKKKRKISYNLSDFFEHLSYECKTELRRLDEKYYGEISRKVKQVRFVPEKGKRLDILVSNTARSNSNQASIVRLSCVGECAVFKNNESDFDLEAWRSLGSDAYHTATKHNAITVVVSFQGILRDVDASVVQAVTEGVFLSEYTYGAYKNKAKNSQKHSQSELFLAVDETSKELTMAVARARAECQAVNFARDLVNCPPNDLQPLDVVRAARAIATRRGSEVRLKVFNHRALTRMNANALLAVAKGSVSEPFLIHLAFRPPRSTKNQKKIVLIGKGVTFDSGGLSIKPAKSMEDMKCDMAGAAAVLGVMKMLSEQPSHLRPKHEVHVVIPSTENMVNGQATRPGNIVRAMNGKTVEILNTDAEGRLILADALSYSARLKPDVIIDLATLTGACVVALGSDYAAIFSNSEALEAQLKQNARRAGEELWPLPLAKQYRPLLDSPIADLRNIGTGGPGAIIGALFLQEFVPDGAQWAHLDIAGPAFRTKANEYVPEGGTGFGVRTLLRYLEVDI